MELIEQEKRIMIRKYLVAAFITFPFLGACEMYIASKPNITGGILCDVLGHQVVDGGGRTTGNNEAVSLREFLGNRIGQPVYLVDELKTAEALERSCDGHPTTWRNTDTGQRYSVTPTQTYQWKSARCRDFTTSAENQGHEKVIHSMACRQPDGYWRVPKDVKAADWQKSVATRLPGNGVGRVRASSPFNP